MLAEDRAMSHKGPPWVPDYDNTRKCRKEEVSAGSRPLVKALRREIALICPRSSAAKVPGAAGASARVARLENFWLLDVRSSYANPFPWEHSSTPTPSRTAGVASETATA